ncbi:nuclear transport factor 2 family protein [Dyadobacter subterraneus]|uniref:Nuclear transport factor 2 family protein n=1 Tax=Dyadobacter subterraneus TaxID=2773304 RepID=A0ABR9W950_9BACT|nr:nuclear transport factor 2 family protein [Dyadobacter subterraneus]MBE9461649.1 nuclear transport factor 2 family protein [Dyadobacter subterraneus]
MDYQKILNGLYQDFNQRNIEAVLAHVHTNVTWPNGWEGGYVYGHDQVREYWLRQWQEIDPNVVPVSFQVRPGGLIAVGVHQIIRDLNGQVLSDGLVTHTYSFEDEKVRSMVIEENEENIH